MAVIRLVIEVDREVYPELFDMLEAMDGSFPREERLRQLAASGLAWERFRQMAQAGLFGQALPPGMAAAQPAAPAPVAAPTGLAATPASSALRRRMPAPAAHAAPAAPPAAAERSDFVDLGIGDGTPPPAARAARTRTPAHPIDELPILLDVVEPVTPPATARPRRKAAGTKAEALPEHRVTEPGELDAALADTETAATRDAALADAEPFGVSRAAPLADHDATEEAAAPRDAGPDAAPSAPRGDDEPAGPPPDGQAARGEVITLMTTKPSTRSRLMRMKERGLFQNG